MSKNSKNRRNNSHSKFNIDDSTLSSDNLTKIPLTPALIWPNFEFSNMSNKIIEKDEHEFCYFSGWNTQLANYDTFKSIYQICPGSSEFWEKFRESKDIIFWDKFFDEDAIRRVDHELKLVTSNILGDKIYKEIYILCENDYDKITKIYEDLKDYSIDVYKKNMIKIYKVKNADWFHDRFAIMDQEIWHCGSTPGGIERCLNALSRGWYDRDNRLRKFFLEAVHIYEK